MTPKSERNIRVAATKNLELCLAGMLSKLCIPSVSCDCAKVILPLLCFQGAKSCRYCCDFDAVQIINREIVCC